VATFEHYRKEIQRVMSTTGTRGTEHIDAIINETVRDILATRDWMFMQRTFQLRTWPKISAGTIAVNKGSRLFTITGATIHKGYQGGFALVTPTGGTVTTDRYRVKEVLTTTTGEFEHPWAGDDDATATYAIFQDKYFLPYDCESVFEGSVWYERSPFIMSPITRRSMEIMQFDNVAAEGDPWYWIDDAVCETDMLRHGQTITTSVDSKIITAAAPEFTGTIWDADGSGDVFIGLPIHMKTTARSRVNSVYEVTSSTTIKMEEEFQGTAESGVRKIIGRKGDKMIQLMPSPDTSRGFGGVYRQRYLGMYHDDDFCPIPDEWEHVVISGAAYRAIRRQDTEETDTMRWTSHRQQYQKGLEDMAAKDHPHQDTVIVPVRHGAPAYDTQPQALRDYGQFPAS
jgi:hypothetical protein